jgi:excisionase family DNA binding protein
MTPPDPRHAPLLPVAVVAARLAVSVRAVRRLIAAGRLQAVRLGPRSTRVPETALNAFVAAGAR